MRRGARHRLEACSTAVLEGWHRHLACVLTFRNRNYMARHDSASPGLDVPARRWAPRPLACPAVLVNASCGRHGQTMITHLRKCVIIAASCARRLVVGPDQDFTLAQVYNHRSVMRVAARRWSRPHVSPRFCFTADRDVPARRWAPRPLACPAVLVNASCGGHGWTSQPWHSSTVMLTRSRIVASHIAWRVPETGREPLWGVMLPPPSSDE